MNVGDGDVPGSVIAEVVMEVVRYIQWTLSTVTLSEGSGEHLDLSGKMLLESLLSVKRDASVPQRPLIREEVYVKADECWIKIEVVMAAHQANLQNALMTLEAVGVLESWNVMVHENEPF